MHNFQFYPVIMFVIVCMISDILHIICRYFCALYTKFHLPGLNGSWVPHCSFTFFNPLNAELNPICHLLALLGDHHILHVSRVRVKEEGQKTRPEWKCHIFWRPDHIELRYPMWCYANIASTLWVCTIAMLVLLIVTNAFVSVVVCSSF